MAPHKRKAHRPSETPPLGGTLTKVNAAITRLWESAWTEFIPFLDYGGCCRMRVLQ